MRTEIGWLLLWMVLSIIVYLLVKASFFNEGLSKKVIGDELRKILVLLKTAVRKSLVILKKGRWGAVLVVGVFLIAVYGKKISPETLTSGTSSISKITVVIAILMFFVIVVIIAGTINARLEESSLREARDDDKSVSSWKIRTQQLIEKWERWQIWIATIIVAIAVYLAWPTAWSYLIKNYALLIILVGMIVLYAKSAGSRSTAKFLITITFLLLVVKIITPAEAQESIKERLLYGSPSAKIQEREVITKKNKWEICDKNQCGEVETFEFVLGNPRKLVAKYTVGTKPHRCVFVWESENGGLWYRGNPPANGSFVLKKVSEEFWQGHCRDSTNKEEGLLSLSLVKP